MQTIARSLFSGEDRYDGRIVALRALSELREETTGVFIMRFIISAWEQVVYDWL